MSYSWCSSLAPCSAVARSSLPNFGLDSWEREQADHCTARRPSIVIRFDFILTIDLGLLRADQSAHSAPFAERLRVPRGQLVCLLARLAHESRAFEHITSPSAVTRPRHTSASLDAETRVGEGNEGRRKDRDRRGETFGNALSLDGQRDAPGRVTTPTLVSPAGRRTAMARTSRLWRSFCELGAGAASPVSCLTTRS